VGSSGSCVRNFFDLLIYTPEILNKIMKLNPRLKNIMALQVI